MNNYWEIKRADAFNVSEQLSKLSDEATPQKVLGQLQNYILTILKQNPKDTFFIDDMKSIEQAKKEIALGMKKDVVFDELCLKIIR